MFTLLISSQYTLEYVDHQVLVYFISAQTNSLSLITIEKARLIHRIRLVSIIIFLGI